MKNLLSLSTLILLLMSCGSQDAEQGIYEIRNRYGCKVTFNSTASIDTNDGTQTTAELVLTGGNLSSFDLENSASYSAFVVFEDLDNKSKYSAIKSTVVRNENGRETRTTFDYSSNDLQAVSDKLDVFLNARKAFISGDVRQLIGLLAPELKESASETLLANQSQFKEMSTQIQDAVLAGFKLTDNGDILYQGALVIGDQIAIFDVVTTRDPNDRTINFVQF